MTGTRPETPPRYRYIRSGTSDDEQENDGNGNTVLAARKRAGSVGRPVLISRRLDRQRHGGTHVLGEAAVPPQSVLQAPALLGLGCLDANASFGLDMFTRRHLDFAANVPNESRNWIGNDPMAFIPAVPAAPSSAWPCMVAKSACRSQSVGTHVRRESAFLRPSGSFSVHQRLHPPWRPRLRAPTLSFLMFHLAATLSLGRVFLAQLPHACKLMGKNIVRHRGHRSQGQGRCSRSQSKMRKCKCKQTVSSSIFALLALTAFFRLWMSIPPLGSRKNTPPYKNYSGSKACQGSLTRILSSLGFLAA